MTCVPSCVYCSCVCMSVWVSEFSIMWYILYKIVRFSRYSSKDCCCLLLPTYSYVFVILARDEERMYFGQRALFSKRGNETLCLLALPVGSTTITIALFAILYDDMLVARSSLMLLLSGCCGRFLKYATNRRKCPRKYFRNNFSAYPCSFLSLLKHPVSPEVLQYNTQHTRTVAYY